MALGENIKKKTVPPSSVEDKPSGNGHTEAQLASEDAGSVQLRRELSARINVLNEAALVSETDLYGTIVYANQKFCETSKYTFEELLGKPHSIIRHPDTPKAMFKEMWETIKGGDIFHGEIKNRTKDGTAYWVDATIAPVLDETGKPIKYVAVRFDITERKRLEEENEQKLLSLKEKEENFRQILHAIGQSNGFLEMSPEGIVQDANELYLQFTGYKREELIGKPHELLCEAEMVQSAAYKTLWANLRGGLFDKETYRRRHKNGSVVWLEGTYNPIVDAHGKVIRILQYVQDATERRQRNSENRGKLAAISQSYGTIEYQLDGTILSVNPAFEQLIGYRENELKGLNHRILCEKSYVKSQEYEALWRKMQYGDVDGGVYQMLSKTGQVVWLQASYTPILDLDGKPFKVVQYATDVTEQIELQLESDRLKGELESRVGSLNAAALMSETDLYGTITFINDKFCEVSGFTREELIGKPHNVIRHPSTPKAVFKQLWENIQSGKMFQQVYRNKHKNGGHYWVDATIAPVLDKDGKPVRYIGLRFDVTEQIDSRKEVEGMLEAIGESNTMVGFNLQGEIIEVNPLFCQRTGYTEAELLGKHHSLLLFGPKEHDSLWEKLLREEFDKFTYKRKRKDGKVIWLEGTYNPITDIDGNIQKIVQVAQDVTERRLRNAENRGKVSAMGRGNAVVELGLDGTLLSANENFLKPLGYTPQEVAGKHHSILVEPSHANSAAYKAFWEKLRRGEYDQNTYKRIGKQGQVVWYDATYNPITDDEGNLLKVVKYAQDVTERRLRNAENRGKITAIDESYGAIEFAMDGTILHANENYLKFFGYALEDLKGKHHSLLCPPEYVKSAAYKLLWEKLNRGQNDTGEYERVGKYGREVWLQGSYNPIEDDEGNLLKVAQYVQDITSFNVAFNALRKFLAELKKGNLTAELDLGGITLDGDIADMIRDNIEVRDTIADIISELNRVVQQAGKEGTLSARLEVTDEEGAWKALIEAVNELLSSISEPLQEVSATVENLAKGDLTVRFRAKAAGDIKAMGNALNDAITSLQSLLLKIGEETEVVDVASDQMKGKAEGIEKNTQTVVVEIQGIHEGMLEQVTRTDESSRFAEQIMKTAESTGEQADVINESAVQGVHNSQEGVKIVKKLVEHMEEIAESASSTAKSIYVLTERSEEISRTLNVITDIAAQTNLLALNAAIEAARAGDAGRGFAVVAEEIRKLAEDSRRSAVGIERVIQDVQKDVVLASKSIDKMEGNVKQGNSATRDAREVFETILGSSQETLSISKQVVKAAKEQQTAVASVVKNIEKIVVVSEETAAGTKKASTSADSLNEAVRDIAKTSQELSQTASSLKKEVSKFKLH